MPVFPDKSALVRSEDRMEPVFGSNSVTQPPPPLGVRADDGLVVVTLTMYLWDAIVNVVWGVWRQGCKFPVYLPFESSCIYGHPHGSPGLFPLPYVRSVVVLWDILSAHQNELHFHNTKNYNFCNARKAIYLFIFYCCQQYRY
jgi:hypothetical protein